MLKPIIRLTPLLFIALLSATQLWSFSVAAQAETMQGLTLSPLRQELTLAPGTTDRRTMGVLNSTDQPMTVQLSSEVFSVINPDYTYSFSQGSAIAGWVRFAETEITLAPGESRSVAYEVAVPVGTEPGGAYISIFATNDIQRESTAITLKQRIGLLLYITVDGAVSRTGSLLSLSTPWVVSNSGQWSATLQNSGSAHFRSRFEVTVNDLFGGTVSTRDGDALILPGTVRRVSEPLTVPQWPGIYRVSYSIGLGDQPAYRESRLLVVLPGWLWIIVASLGAAGISVLVFRKWRSRR